MRREACASRSSSFRRRPTRWSSRCGGDRPARAAQSELRLGDLRRRRFDPRAHARDGRAHPRGDHADARPRTSPASRRRAPTIDAVIARLSRGGRAPHRGAARRSDRRCRRTLRAASRRLSATPPNSSPASSVSPTVEVSVSAYPEKHPDSPNVDADIDMLKAKVDAGATRAITQFFFENDALFPLSRPACARAASTSRSCRASCRCRISSRRRILPRAAALPCRPGSPSASTGSTTIAATRKLIAAAVAAEQVLDLVDRGVTDFHFYTMNRADLVFAICHLLGVRPSSRPALRFFPPGESGMRSRQ